MTNQATPYVFWQSRDMLHCSGHSDIYSGYYGENDHISFDGTKSLITIAGGQTVTLSHSIQLCDFATDMVVLELGKVPASVRWEIGGTVRGGEWTSLLKGEGGGTFRAPLSKLNIHHWTAVMEIRLQSDQPAKVEVLRWAVETPHQVADEAQQAEASRILKRATPLERGHIPQFNPKLGAFICAYNRVHPEHYNYWLEDNGEQLWSFGNYPLMMQVYGKPMRDFIVKYCRAGAPVRKVNDQPLMANPFVKPGDIFLDTGLLEVTGTLAEDPHIDFHHSVYEHEFLLSRIAGFHVKYTTSDGQSGRLDLTRPAHSLELDTPRKNNARMTIESANDAVSANFIIDVLRGRATVQVSITNKSGQGLGDVSAGFEFRDCRNYYWSPWSKIKRFDGVALLYADGRPSNRSNMVRLAGPVANNVEVEMQEGEINKATASCVVTPQLSAGAEVSAKLADINSTDRCLVTSIELYKDVDFEEANISPSYVHTYALLGLATWCYRYPDDTEAREVTDRMIDHFLKSIREGRMDAGEDGARDMGYLLWALDILGRDEDTEFIGSYLQERTDAAESYGSSDASGAAIGLRRAGRWDAADRITNKINDTWDFGCLPATQFLGQGALQSPTNIKNAFIQLSYDLWWMYWDEPDKATVHTYRATEEGPAETLSYTLVGFDIIQRLYGGIVPYRLDPVARTQITDLQFDKASGERKMSMSKASLIDIFTYFRAPSKILWNGAQLDESKWRYSDETGVVYITGLSGDGELTLTVIGDPPKDDPDWAPIDYLGLGKRKG